MLDGLVGIIFGAGVTFLLCTVIYVYRFADDVRRGREAEKERVAERAQWARVGEIHREVNSLLVGYKILTSHTTAYGKHYSVREPLKSILDKEKEV